MSATKSLTKKTTVCALYTFVTLSDFKALKAPFTAKLEQLGVRGTLLLAKEGLNGTIAGSHTAINEFIDWLQQDERFRGIDFKLSYHDTAPFHRTKVKLKKEIVTIGLEEVDPNEVVGTYVDPEDWNALIRDPEVTVIDTRNDYEVAIGSFTNALDPHTKTFREFPDYVATELDPHKHKKVAMFCTGGIRCEKASAYMKQQGFDDVYHLKGGVLKYLENVPQEDSLWRGECFVFDDRVAVNHALEQGQYDQCHACRHPITEAQKASEHYVPGVSCPLCYDAHSPEQKARFAQREKQIQLAKARGQAHLGADSHEAAKYNRKQKRDQVKEQQTSLDTKPTNSE